MSSNTVKTSTGNKKNKPNKEVRFKHQFTLWNSKGETNDLPSKTIPDQHLTMAELLKNHSRGLGMDAKHYEGEYFEEQEIPIINDLVDLQQRREELKNRQLDIEEQIQEMEKSGEIQKPPVTSSKDETDTPPTPTTKTEQNPKEPT